MVLRSRPGRRLWEGYREGEGGLPAAGAMQCSEQDPVQPQWAGSLQKSVVQGNIH